MTMMIPTSMMAKTFHATVWGLVLDQHAVAIVDILEKHAQKVSNVEPRQYGWVTILCGEAALCRQKFEKMSPC